MTTASPATAGTSIGRRVTCSPKETRAARSAKAKASAVAIVCSNSWRRNFSSSNSGNSNAASSGPSTFFFFARGYPPGRRRARR